MELIIDPAYAMADRTQWFCCQENPPVHPGVYEFRAKTTLGESQARFRVFNGKAWEDRYLREFIHLHIWEWRGMATGPKGAP